MREYSEKISTWLPFTSRKTKQLTYQPWWKVNIRAGENFPLNLQIFLTTLIIAGFYVAIAFSSARCHVTLVVSYNFEYNKKYSFLCWRLFLPIIRWYQTHTDTLRSAVEKHTCRNRFNGNNWWMRLSDTNTLRQQTPLSSVIFVLLNLDHPCISDKTN